MVLTFAICKLYYVSEEADMPFYAVGRYSRGFGNSWSILITPEYPTRKRLERELRDLKESGYLLEDIMISEASTKSSKKKT